MVPIVLSALLAGVVAATGNVVFAVGFGVAVATIPLVARPWLSMWIALLGALTVVGTVKLYLPQLQLIRWGVPLLAFAALATCVLQNAFSRPAAPARPRPALFWWCSGFLVYAAAVTVLNWRGLGLTVFGLKSYFQVWPAMAILAVSRDRGNFRRQLFWLVLLVAVIQLPFVVQQYLFIVPTRARYGGGLSPADVVAGTFGADYLGGGNNAVLAAFLFVAIGLIAAQWQAGTLKGKIAIGAIALLSFPVFLNEAKVSFVYAWLVFLVLFWRDIAARPGRFILGHLLLLIFTGVFLETYVHLAEESHKATSVADYLGLIAEQNLDRGYGKLALNRFTALTFWFSSHFPRDAVHGLIGHGLGQSLDGSGILDFGSTLGSGRYEGMGIGLTTLSALLWDTGVFGVVLVAAIFLSAYKLAGSLAAGSADAVGGAVFKGCQAAVVILGASLLHKSFFVFELGFQSILAMIFGFLIYSSRWHSTAAGPYIDRAHE